LQNTIAFFDFDGTITSRDTMLALAQFRKGKAGFLMGMTLLSPSLVALKLNIVSAQNAKELFLKKFFGGMRLKEFNELCDSFSKQVLPGLIRDDAMAALKNHSSSGHKVVVVSASATNWIAPWCKENNIEFIATRLETKNDIITGKLEGLNCNGKEKVSRIKEIFNLADYENIYAYGDSAGDQMMLSIATHPGFRVFNK